MPLPPSWLRRLTIFALLLRLLAALLWTVALPHWGYGTPPELAGYVMSDAYTRDTAAWKLAHSGRPLLDAFGYSDAADQYGGLLFLLAAVYRLAGTAAPAPLLTAALMAVFSSHAVPLGWAFARRAFDARTARWTAWGLALYPEAVLLGSTQMRAALAIPLAALGLWGAALAAQERSRRGWLWLGVSFLLALPLSPPVAFTLLTASLLAFLALDDWRVLRHPAARWGLGGAGLVFVLILWLGRGQTPLDALLFWLRKAAQYQGYLSKQASGWMQRTFRALPSWAHLPFLLFYGLLRPLLPAAILGKGAPIWWGIAVWRALGWTVLLAGLFLAAVRVALRRLWTQLPGVLSLAVWGGAFVASYRGGGDLWDNPRYRAVLAVPQVALAAWGFLEQRRHPSPWVRRLLSGAALGALWLFPWYMRRYTPLDWAVVSIFKTLALGGVTLLLYAVWDWARAPGKPHPRPLSHKWERGVRPQGGRGEGV